MVINKLTDMKFIYINKRLPADGMFHGGRFFYYKSCQKTLINEYFCGIIIPDITFFCCFLQTIYANINLGKGKKKYVVIW